MAKKVKTPEEVQASIDKKVARRKIFFGTFSKSLALFLAIAMVFSLAYIAFAPDKAASNPAGPSSGLDPDDGNNPFDEPDDPAPGNPSDPQTPADPQNPQSPADPQNPGTPGTPSTGKMSKADMVKALNEATKTASTAGYNWKRHCEYTKPIKVNAPILGDATNLLNGIISGVAQGETVNSVVGMFIGVGDKEAKVEKGAKEVEGMDQKYMLKAMNLTEGDIKQAADKGNGRILLQLNDSANPQKDGKNALNKATNDFITHQETADGIKNGLGTDAIKLSESTIKYASIIVDATIKDGKLEKLTITCKCDATLILSAGGFNITGTGAMASEAIYSNFVY